MLQSQLMGARSFARPGVQLSTVNWQQDYCVLRHADCCRKE